MDLNETNGNAAISKLAGRNSSSTLSFVFTNNDKNLSASNKEFKESNINSNNSSPTGLKNSLNVENKTSRSRNSSRARSQSPYRKPKVKRTLNDLRRKGLSIGKVCEIFKLHSYNTNLI
jgi:hypothetical protein